MENANFYPFPPFTAKEWKEKINQDLKEKTFSDLCWEKEGLKGKPFYTAEDLPQTLDEVAHADTFGHRSWVNYQSIAVSDDITANRKALEVLQQGADGLIFECSKLPQWDILLKDILLPHCAVAFMCSDEVDLEAFHSGFSKFVSTQGYERDQLNGFVQGKLLRKNLPLRSYVLDIANDVSAPLSLALSLGQIVDDFDASIHLDPEACFDQLQLNLTITNDYFFEIARLRAIRAAVVRLAKGYGLSLTPGQVQIFCQIGPWVEEVEEANNYMLHATSQAMSAVMGGADAIHVHSFISAFPSKPLMAERLARNISGIIKEESHLDKCLDPAEGSYYIEHLSHQLIEQSLELLHEIEQQGGLSKLDRAAFIEKNNQL